MFSLFTYFPIHLFLLIHFYMIWPNMWTWKCFVNAQNVLAWNEIWFKITMYFPKKKNLTWNWLFAQIQIHSNTTHCAYLLWWKTFLPAEIRIYLMKTSVRMSLWMLFCLDFAKCRSVEISFKLIGLKNAHQPTYLPLENAKLVCVPPSCLSPMKYYLNST